jgi:molybdopterin converting factor small subunit
VIPPTMLVHLQYLAQMKRAAGCAGESVELPADCTLAGLFTQIANNHPPAFPPMLLDESGRIRRSLLVFVNDAHADAQLPLRDGDTVTFLAPMAGG